MHLISVRGDNSQEHDLGGCLILKMPFTFDSEVPFSLVVQNHFHCEDILVREYFNSEPMILGVTE